MRYLRARSNTSHADNFWWDVRYEDPDNPVPRPLRMLGAGARAVECNREEAAAALAWAREQDAWPASLPHDSAPVYVRNVTSA
jgi:hypothetical protein